MNQEIRSDEVVLFRAAKLMEIATDCALALDRLARIMMGCGSDCPLRQERSSYQDFYSSAIESQYVS